MTIVKKMLAATALTFGAFAAMSSANAAYTVLAQDATLTAAPGSGLGVFETVDFTLGGAGSFTLQLTADSLSAITDVYLFKSDDASNFIAVSSGSATTNTLTYTYNNLAGGSQAYFAQVWGTTGALANVSYSVSPSAVPEPESYALALAGLGVVGMLSARRRRSV